MFYERELHFLCEVFKKSLVRASVVKSDNLPTEIAAFDLKQGLGSASIFTARHQLPKELDFGTVYKLKDSLGLCFIFFLLPDNDDKSTLLVGPYSTSAASASHVLELGEKNGISPKRQRYLEEYLLGIPVLTDASPLFLMLNAFCELIWNSPSFTIIDLNESQPLSVSPINEALKDKGIDDTIVNIKTMEMRYAFENELIRAVSLGQLHMEGRLFSSFSQQMLENRIPDALRNAKNYSIIMNTLLRKAAESGGVHPVYVDRVSSELASRIEALPSASETGSLMLEMFRTYCHLVRKHSLQHLSPTVQKTVLIIDSDLSANLSPGILAKNQNISLGYLSTIFKKETGKTISEYIRDMRMEQAIHLLTTTNLQIQTVALHCGIVDVQYFSKIFKKYTGKSPKEYRDCRNHAHGTRKPAF